MFTNKLGPISTIMSQRPDTRFREMFERNCCTYVGDSVSYIDYIAATYEINIGLLNAIRLTEVVYEDMTTCFITSPA